MTATPIVSVRMKDVSWHLPVQGKLLSYAHEVVVVVVVVVLLLYVHGKHLRSCRDGQLT